MALKRPSNDLTSTPDLPTRPSRFTRLVRSSRLLVLLSFLGAASGACDSGYHQTFAVPTSDSFGSARGSYIPLQISAPSPEVLEKNRIDKIKTNDKKRIAARNSNRINKKAASVQGFEKKRKELLKNLNSGKKVSYQEVIFELMERLDQGVEDFTVDAAIVFLDDKLKEINPNLSAAPDLASLQKLMDAFTPKSAYDVTHSSASDSLSCEVCDKSQNCVARERILAAAFEAAYPKYKDRLYHQQFKDHRRLLVDLKGDGDYYVLDPGAKDSENLIPISQDSKTKNERSIVMPFKTYLRAYAGAKFDSYKDQIVQHGPESQEVTGAPIADDGPDFVTDEITQQPSYRDKFNLGKFGDSDAVYSGRSVKSDNQAEEELFRVNLKEKQDDFERRLGKGMTTLTVEDAKIAATLEFAFLKPIKYLSVEAAAELAKFRGILIELSGLEETSAAVARKLATIKGSGPLSNNLSLPRLKQISPEVARELAKFNGHLRLGIEGIDASNAREFAQFKGPIISFDQVVHLTPEISSSLASPRSESFVPSSKEWGVGYVFNGLKDVSAETIAPLVQLPYSRIFLDGLENPSLELLEELGKMDNSKHLRWLSLGSVRRMSADQIRAMSGIKADLIYFSGLEEPISEEEARAWESFDCNIALLNKALWPKSLPLPQIDKEIDCMLYLSLDPNVESL